jgi:NADH dehydrogenase
MPGRVFVTGASGFVGSAVIDELAARHYSTFALSHHTRLTDDERVGIVRGSLFDEKALDEGLLGSDAVIHLVGIIKERPSKGVTFERIHFDGTRSIVEAAKRNGVKRYVHMSALGTRADAVSEYHKTKFKAEEFVRASGLDWTIFRPSLIHGPRGEFMQMEARWARRTAPPFLFMPYFGAGALGLRGAGLLQPVYVKDVARAFVDALENKMTIGEVYPLGGADRITWPQLHDITSRVLEDKPAKEIKHSWQMLTMPFGAILANRRYAMPLPAWYAKLLTSVVPGAMLPFNRAQVQMSQEDNTCDNTKFVDDFGWTPQSFEPALRSYAAQFQ